MNLFATSPEWLLWVLAAVLVAAMVQDAVQLRISNIFSILTLVLAAAGAVLSGLTIDLWQNVAAFAVVLTVGTILFSRGVLGGGDVKLFAAVALWGDGFTALRLVIAILLAGGVLALVTLTARTTAPESWREHVKVLRPKAGIPYGIAITAGALIVIAMSQALQPAPANPYLDSLRAQMNRSS